MVDEFEDKEFSFGGNFMRFKFKTDDNLVYDEKINIPVCVISLSSIIQKEYIYCPALKLQRCFYESESFLKIDCDRQLYKVWFISGLI